jgi:hypothetical protein
LKEAFFHARPPITTAHPSCLAGRPVEVLGAFFSPLQLRIFQKISNCAVTNLLERIFAAVNDPVR